MFFFGVESSWKIEDIKSSMISYSVFSEHADKFIDEHYFLFRNSGNRHFSAVTSGNLIFDFQQLRSLVAKFMHARHICFFVPDLFCISNFVQE